MQAFFEGIQGLTVLDVFMYAMPLSKLAFLVLFIALIVTAVLAVLRYSGGGSRMGLFLIGGGAIGVGLLAALYNASIIRVASESTGVTDIRILAPSIFEVVLLLGLSLLVAAITLAGALPAQKK